MDTLTALEKEIVILVALGCKNREIADKLCLAEQTARNYLCVIYQKVGIKNRAGLTSYAWEQGWIDSTQGEIICKVQMYFVFGTNQARP